MGIGAWRTERDAPYAFAGRQEERDRLHSYLELIASGETARNAGIVLIDGVQGIGKTSLLEQFLNEAEQSGHAVLRTTPQQMARDADSVVLDIAASIRGKPARRRSVAGASVGVAGLLKAGVTLDAPQTAVRQVLGRLSDEVAGKRCRCLVVAIDEIQNIGAEGAGLLAELHANVWQLPILVATAGLQNASYTLADHGLSRRALDLTLGHLAPSESRFALREGIRAAGYAARVSETVLDDMVRSSCGFPQHVYCHIHGVQMATRSGGRLSDAAVLAEAMRVADEQRVQYYQRRAESVPVGVRTFSSIAARWILARKASGQDSRSARFKQHLGEQHQDLLNIENITPAQVLDALIVKGVVSLRDDAIDIPIPSFASFLADKARS